VETGEERKLLVWQRRLTVAVLLLALCFLILQIGSYFADLLRILGISVLLSYLFINVVDYLEKYLRNRGVAILVVYAVLLAATVVGAILVVPAMVFQVTQLVETVWDKLPEFVSWLGQACAPLESRLHAAQIDVRVIDILNSLANSLPKPDPGAVFTRLTDVAMSTMTWLIYSISIFVVSFYFLLEGHRISDWIIGLFPRKYRNALHLTAADMDRNMQAFFRGQLVLGLLSGIVMLGVYLVLGVPYALVLSVFLAVWEIVPVIGPPIGFYPAIIPVAINGMDHFSANKFVQILVLIVIFNVLQWLKDNVLAPRYIGNVIGVHPILIFIAILAGARLDGICGIIFALPVACLLNVLTRHLPSLAGDETASFRPELMEDIASKTSEPGMDFSAGSTAEIQGKSESES
jgi:predicted PurR-regulated permease PerM